MGVPKTKWSAQEETALISGVRRYGIGKWRLIQKDPELGAVLRQRSNVDLKDKWRNMHPNDQAEAVQAKYAAERPAGGYVPPASRDVSKPKGPKGGRAGAAAAAAIAAEAEGAGGAAAARQIETLVFDAVRTLKHAATMDGIAVAIEDIYNVPAKFREQLKEHLRSLVAAGKLAKNKTVFSLPTSARCAAAAAAVTEVKVAGYRSRPGAGGKVPEFFINGKRLTAEEIAEEAERAVREAEEAAAAAEAAAREAEHLEREAINLEREAARGVLR